MNFIKQLRIKELIAFVLAAASALLVMLPAARAEDNVAPEGFVALFNGHDLSGWKIPEGDGGHWKVINGVIDYDAESEAKGDKSRAKEATKNQFAGLGTEERVNRVCWVRSIMTLPVIEGGMRNVVLFGKGTLGGLIGRGEGVKRIVDVCVRPTEGILARRVMIGRLIDRHGSFLLGRTSGRATLGMRAVLVQRVFVFFHKTCHIRTMNYSLSTLFG